MLDFDAFLSTGAIMSLDGNQLLIAYGKSSFLENEALLDTTFPAFYITDFFLKTSRPWVQYASFELVIVSDLLALIPSSDELVPEWTLSQKSVFQEAFNEVQASFKDGSLSKVVPYVFSDSLTIMSKRRLAHSLRHALLNIQKYPGHIYGQWNETQGFLGVTPEILFSQNKQQPKRLDTMALAGTTTISQIEINQKLLNEHQIVVDDICCTLHTFGDVEKESLQLLRLSKLNHLMTPIQVQLKQSFNFTQLVHALHPTPALGAFPKENGKAWLSRYQEKIDRLHFGAPIGLKFNGHALCYVGIRQVQWSKNGMRIGAGCGVIKESLFDEEWSEIELKISAIKGLLGL